MNNFVLKNLSDSHIYYEPFPHIIIHNALPENCAENLKAEILIADQCIDCSDKSKARFAFTLQEAKNKKLDAISQFMEDHSGDKLSEKIFNIFEKNILINLTHLEKKDLTPQATSNTVLIKNPPVESGSLTPRSAHLDNLKDIFAFLYYVRLPEDKTPGGSLQLFRYKDRFHGFDRSSLIDTQYLPQKDIILEKEIPYTDNTFVCFIDGIHSIHGVTPRKKSPWSRFYFTGGAQATKNCYSPRQYLSPKEKVIDYSGHIIQKTRKKLAKPYDRDLV